MCASGCAKYPQTIIIEFVQDKCDLLNSVKIGDEVTISININGREWVDPKGEVKVFNSIQGWRIEQGETKELFHWSAPPLNNFGVGETLSVKFEGEEEIHQYVVVAKFLRGEFAWPNSMPANSRFDFRLKRFT